MNALHCQITRIAEFLLTQRFSADSLQFYADLFQNLADGLATEAAPADLRLRHRQKGEAQMSAPHLTPPIALLDLQRCFDWLDANERELRWIADRKAALDPEAPLNVLGIEDHEFIAFLDGLRTCADRLQQHLDAGARS